MMEGCLVDRYMHHDQYCEFGALLQRGVRPPTQQHVPICSELLENLHISGANWSTSFQVINVSALMAATVYNETACF